VARAQAKVAHRKTPVQDRSRETVRRILDAAATVLKERGYEGASANRIAAAANISPGSLYQYFPNKDAILDAMVADYTEQLRDKVSSRLYEILGNCKDREVLATTLVGVYVDAMLERPEVWRVISGQLPGHTGRGVLRPVDTLIREIIRGYIAAVPDRRPDVDVDATTWILSQLLAIPIRYVIDQPPISKDAFISQLTRLALSLVT
jgi:AcrR family transcriptional regulator